VTGQRSRVSVALALALAVGGCAAGDEGEVERVSVGDIELAPPSGWVARELAPTIREWSPATNPRKETITVVVGPPMLGDAERAFTATRAAQGLLPDVQLRGSARMTTKSGLAGMQFDLTFRPDAGGGRVYQRSHVVLVAGDHAVHVLYTAADADPAGTVLAEVLATIQRGG